MSYDPEDFANLHFPHSKRKVPVYATLLKHPNLGVTAEEINRELNLETDKNAIEDTRRVLREIEDRIEETLSMNPRGPPTKVYKPGSLRDSYRDPILTHTFGKGRREFCDLHAYFTLACENYDNPMQCSDPNCKICKANGKRTCWDLEPSK